jgi:hypothetical protein
MSTYPPHRAPNDRFADAYTAFANDLAAVLDLTTGAAEATHSATYQTFSADLATALHLNAGLVAIIGNATHNSAPSGRRLVAELGSLTDLERLILRSRPSYNRLRRGLALLAELDLACELARVFSHDLDRDHYHDLDPDHALNIDHAQLVRTLDETLNHAFNYILDEAVDPDLARGLTHSRVLARDLARNLAQDLAHAHAAARAKAFNHALAYALTVARNRARDLYSALAHARAVSRAHVRFLARHLGFDLDLDLASTSRLLEELIEVADNFVAADLRAAVDFDATGWEGLRWSPSTMWPPGWEDSVRAISIEITPGVFQVVRDGRDSRSLHEVGT